MDARHERSCLQRRAAAAGLHSPQLDDERQPRAGSLAQGSCCASATKQSRAPEHAQIHAGAAYAGADWADCTHPFATEQFLQHAPRLPRMLNAMRGSSAGRGERRMRGQVPRLSGGHALAVRDQRCQLDDGCCLLLRYRLEGCSGARMSCPCILVHMGE